MARSITVKASGTDLVEDGHEGTPDLNLPFLQTPQRCSTARHTSHSTHTWSGHLCRQTPGLVVCADATDCSVFFLRAPWPRQQIFCGSDCEVPGDRQAPACMHHPQTAQLKHTDSFVPRQCSQQSRAESTFLHVHNNYSRGLEELGPG